MKQLRYVDFDCPTCAVPCTRFVYVDTDTGLPCGDDEHQYCQEPMSDGRCATEDEPLGTWCDELLVSREMSGVGYMKTIVKGSSDFNERERTRLEKRSDDHWKRQGRDEAIDRERALMKKHGAVGGVR